MKIPKQPTAPEFEHLILSHSMQIKYQNEFIKIHTFVIHKPEKYFKIIYFKFYNLILLVKIQKRTAFIRISYLYP